MIAQYNTKTIVIGAAALIVAVALLSWGYSAHKKSGAGKTIHALVTDTSARLRDALESEAAPPPTDRARLVKKLDDHAATADASLQTLKRLDGAPVQFADAADDYLVTAREILKKQADSHRYRLLLAESSQALRAHMRVDNHTRAWIQEAVKAKERVNRDYRGYNLNADLLDKLLGSFAASQKKIAPHAGRAILIEGSLVADARGRVQEDMKAVEAEFEKLTRIAAPK